MKLNPRCREELAVYRDAENLAFDALPDPQLARLAGLNAVETLRQKRETEYRRRCKDSKPNGA